jgi:hypothetical protein
MRYIKIDIATQRLQLFDENVIILEWLVSTAYKGVGELAGSGCTPRGWLVIRAKVGRIAQSIVFLLDDALREKFIAPIIVSVTLSVIGF